MGEQEPQTASKTSPTGTHSHLSEPHNPSDRARYPAVARRLLHQLFSPIGRQFIEASAPIIRRQAPFAGDPSIQFEPLEGGIERALLHPQEVVGQLLDQLRD